MVSVLDTLIRSCFLSHNPHLCPCPGGVSETQVQVRQRSHGLHEDVLPSDTTEGGHKRKRNVKENRKRCQCCCKAGGNARTVPRAAVRYCDLGVRA